MPAIGAPLCDENLPKASTFLSCLCGENWVATRWRIEAQEKEDSMTSTETGSGSADRIIESFQGAGNTALESVRKFLDAVNGAFPDVGADHGPTPADHRFGVQND